jgi:hypothetical protein
LKDLAHTSPNVELLENKQKKQKKGKYLGIKIYPKNVIWIS